MSVEQVVNLDIVPQKNPPHLRVTEYDAGVNGWVITVNLFKDGQPWEPPTSAVASVEGTKSNGVGFQTEGHIMHWDTPCVMFTLTESMTDVSGAAWVKIVFTINDSKIATCGLWLDIERAGVEADTIIGGSGFEEQISNAVDEWLEDQDFFSPTISVEEIEGGHEVTVHDSNGTQSFEVLNGKDGGISDEIKTALLNCFQNVAWIGNNGSALYNALYDALYPPQPEVPDGYTQYDYIKSTKTSNITLDARNTINLKVYPNIFAHNVEVEFGFETGVGQYTNLFFGGQNNPGGSSPPNNAFAFSVNAGGLSMHANGKYTNYQQNIPNVPKKKNIARYFGSIASPSSYQANDETPYSIAWASGGETLETQLSVCGIRNYYNTSASLVPYVLCGRITVMAIDGTVQEKYIPCVRDEDSVIGLYESVEGVFYTTSQPAWATIGNASCYYAVGNWEA